MCIARDELEYQALVEAERRGEAGGRAGEDVAPVAYLARIVRPAYARGWIDSATLEVWEGALVAGILGEDERVRFFIEQVRRRIERYGGTVGGQRALLARHLGVHTHGLVIESEEDGQAVFAHDGRQYLVIGRTVAERRIGRHLERRMRSYVRALTRDRQQWSRWLATARGVRVADGVTLADVGLAVHRGDDSLSATLAGRDLGSWAAVLTGARRSGAVLENEIDGHLVIAIRPV